MGLIPEHHRSRALLLENVFDSVDDISRPPKNFSDLVKLGKQVEFGHTWQCLPMTFLANLVFFTLVKIKMDWVAQMS